MCRLKETDVSYVKPSELILLVYFDWGYSMDMFLFSLFYEEGMLLICVNVITCSSPTINAALFDSFQ